MNGDGIIVAVGGEERTPGLNVARLNGVGAQNAKAVLVFILIPIYLPRIVVDFAVAVIVDIVAKFGLKWALCDAAIVAIVAAVVLVAALIGDRAIAIFIAKADRLRIAVFIAIGAIANLCVTRKALSVAIVAVVSHGVSLRVFAVCILMTVVVLVRRQELAGVLRTGAGVLGASDAIIAARLHARLDAAVRVSHLRTRIADLFAVTEVAVRTCVVFLTDFPAAFAS